MSWRTVIVKNKCKLSYKNGYMLVRGDEVNMLHLSEIGTIIIDTLSVTITSYLLAELVSNKIKIVFCDENHNPNSEVVPYYGSHNTSKKIAKQIEWNEEKIEVLVAVIIKQKILNQAKLLEKLGLKNSEKLEGYAENVIEDDSTNREGHAAKVYFNTLFGKNFTRELDTNINKALNYGYSMILSSFNKEIVAGGYLTQIGIKHRNEFNFFNLSCDFMEPFRIIVDEFVYLNKDREFDSEYKYEIVNLLNKQVIINEKEHYLSNAIKIYCKSLLDLLDSSKPNKIIMYEFV